MPAFAHKPTVLAGCLLAMLSVVPDTAAQHRDAAAVKGRPSAARNSGRQLPVVTPEREAAAMTFVTRHHPRLAELLIYLQEQDPRQYQRAVRDLFRISERLAQLQERDSARYEMELRAWKVRSRIELLAAQLAMQDDPAVRQQLRDALRQQMAVQQDLLQRERKRAADRVQRIDDQLEELKSRQQGNLDKRIDALVERKTKGGRVQTPETSSQGQGER